MLIEENTEEARIINVVDCPMGCGKTSAAINYMNSLPYNERIVYASPYLREGTRIHDGCTRKHISVIEEDKKDGRKVTDFKRRIGRGENVACTHALLTWLDPVAIETIQKRSYTLIIDEAYEVIQTATEAEKKQLFFMLDHGALSIDNDTGLVSFRNEYEEKSCACLSGKMVGLVKSRHVHLIDNKIFIWVFPVDMLNAFKRVIVMTYMFDAQPIHYWLLHNGYDINYCGARKNESGAYEFCTPDKADGFKCDVARKIHIYRKEKINRIGEKRNTLSSGWFRRDFAGGCAGISQLAKNYSNFQKNICKCSSRDFMWTCFHGDKVRSAIVSACKNISHCFVSPTARAENTYSDRHCLGYGISWYTHPDSYNYFKSVGYTMDRDRWELSTMLQWIWRSAIRKGEDIYIYIPSKKMRRLLTDWLEEISKGGEPCEV